MFHRFIKLEIVDFFLCFGIYFFVLLEETELKMIKLRLRPRISDYRVNRYGFYLKETLKVFEENEGKNIWILKWSNLVLKDDKKAWKRVGGSFLKLREKSIKFSLKMSLQNLIVMLNTAELPTTLFHVKPFKKVFSLFTLNQTTEQAVSKINISTISKETTI